MKLDRIKVYHYKPRTDPRVKLFLKIFLIAIVIILVSIKVCNGDPGFLISDHEFTNQDFNFEQTKKFIKQFKKNKYSTNQVYTIYEAARYYKINVLVVLSKIQQESGTVKNYNTNRYAWRMNRAMSYGMYIKETIKGRRYYKYAGFEAQIWNGAQALRVYYNNWRPGEKITLKNNDDIIIPHNAATYSLYCYTPFYGVHNTYNRQAAGNIIFLKIYQNLKSLWIKK